MFKHSLASPDCILTKTDKSKKISLRIIYNYKTIRKPVLLE